MRSPRAGCHRGFIFLLIRMRDFLRMIGRLCGLGHNPWAAGTRRPAEGTENGPRTSGKVSGSSAIGRRRPECLDDDLHCDVFARATYFLLNDRSLKP